MSVKEEERIKDMVRMGRLMQRGSGDGVVKGISLRDYYVLAGLGDRMSPLRTLERKVENVQGEAERIEHNNRVRDRV